MKKNNQEKILKLIFIIAIIFISASIIFVIFRFLYKSQIIKVNRSILPRPHTSEQSSSDLGLGFGLSKESLSLVSRLSPEKDFVDLMLNQSMAKLLKNNFPFPVKISCFARSLEQMSQTVSLAHNEGVKCDYLAYNPEQREGTPEIEFSDFISSVTKAKDIARKYGADLAMAPGLKYMISNENLYSQAASYSDVWLIQSQGYQVNTETDQRVPISDYRAQIEHIVKLLRQGNSNIKIWVQISTTPGRVGHEQPFSADEVVNLAKSLNGLVDAVRIYTKDDPSKSETLTQIVNLLRPL